ncbi:MAG: hypothetical protein CMD02_07505 [Flavobacteriales bacterium]|nr:hypothetical protein [Flavobacteriales bacterium]
MKNIFNIIRFFTAISLIISMIYLSLNSLDNKYCSLSDVTIELDDNSFVTPDIIVSYLDENMLYPDSIKLDKCSFSQIENLLISHPSIKKATVYSDWNGNVSIHVEQRKPIIRIQNEKEGYYLDADGLRMPLSNYFTARMLLVTGNVNSLIEDELFFIANKIYNDVFLKQLIVQIDVINSELLMLTRVGEQIEFGKIIDINEKFNKLMLYYEKGNTQKKEYKTLNLKFKNQIVCTKK